MSLLLLKNNTKIQLFIERESERERERKGGIITFWRKVAVRKVMT